jgi:hypothetical protein
MHSVVYIIMTKRFNKWYRLGVDNSDTWDSSKKRSRFHFFFTIYINDLPDVVQNIAKKAFWKSKYIISIAFRLSSCSVQLSSTSINCVAQDLPFIKPC